MDIVLDEVWPHKIPRERAERSGVWGKKLSLLAGKRIDVHAPSGSGKTTFVHLLYGLRKDYDGQLSFDQKSATGFNYRSWAHLRRNHLSVVFQDLRLFPELSAIENIQLKAALPHESQAAEIGDSDIRAMAESLGIAGKMAQSAGTLSQGERQRVAIIRALCQPFDWLLLDEPFSHLDKANISKALELIEAAVQQRQAGIIFAGLGFDYGLRTDEKLEL